MTNIALIFSASLFSSAHWVVSMRHTLASFCQNRTAWGILLSVGLCSACAIPPTTKEVEEKLPTEYVPISELSVAVLAQQGLAAFKGNRFGEAVLRYTQAIERANSDESITDDDLIGLERNLAVALNSWGLPDEGVKRLRILAARLPKSATLRFALANALHSADRDGQALEQYEEAIRLLRSPAEAVIGGRASSSAASATAAGPSGTAAREERKVDWSSVATIARTASAVAYKSGDEEKARCLSELAFQLSNNRADLLAHGAILLAVGRPEDVRPAVEKLFPAPAFGPDAAILALVAQAELALGNTQEFALLAGNAEKAGLLSLEDRIILTKLYSWVPEEELVVTSSPVESSPAKVSDFPANNGKKLNAGKEQGAAQQEGDAKHFGSAGGAPDVTGTETPELVTTPENPFKKDEALLDASVISGSPSASFDILRTRFESRSGD